MSRKVNLAVTLRVVGRPEARVPKRMPPKPSRERPARESLADLVLAALRDAGRPLPLPELAEELCRRGRSACPARLLAAVLRLGRRGLVVRVPGGYLAPPEPVAPDPRWRKPPRPLRVAPPEPLVEAVLAALRRFDGPTRVFTLRELLALQGRPCGNAEATAALITLDRRGVVAQVRGGYVAT